MFRPLLRIMQAFMLAILTIVGVFVPVQASHAASYSFDVDCTYAYYTNVNTTATVTLSPGDSVTFTNLTTSGNGFCNAQYTVLNLADYFSSYPVSPFGTTRTYVVKSGAAAVNNGRIAIFTTNLSGGSNNGKQFYFTIVSTAKTVSFNANGGSGTMAAQSASGATNLSANTFTRAGYTFTGWNTAANGSGTPYVNQSSFPFSSNTTLFAQWAAIPRTVTYDANGGSGSMSAQGSSSAAAISPVAFNRSGYTFTGWNTAANGSGTAYADQATYSFSSDLTLYAQWALVTKTVTFDANGGSGSMSAQVSGSSLALISNSFTRSGYTFSVWNTAANGSGLTYADQASYSFASDVTLYAQWVAIPRTVTFDSNGGLGSMNTHTGSSTTSLYANAFTRTGYSFAGWNTSANGTGTAYADQASYSFASDVTLYAQWTAVPRVLTFNGNGGAGTMTAQSGTALAAISANAYARPGFTFSGWNSSANGTGTAYADQASYSFASDVTLYAQWVAIPHTVTFNANGGAGSMAVQSGSTATPLSANAFTRTGYTFAGWNTSANGAGTDYADLATFWFTVNENLYAQWSALPRILTFDGNGGSGSMAPQSGASSRSIDANVFVRSGYSFAGWNTAANGSGTPYADQSSHAFASDETLYAQWATSPAFNAQPQPQPETQAVRSSVKVTRIFVEGASSPRVLVIKGTNFDKNFIALLGGAPLTVQKVGADEMRFELPADLYGMQLISLKDTASNFKFEGIAALGSKPGESQMPAKSSSISNFKSGTATLTATMKQTLLKMAKANSQSSTIRCVGYTAGPTVLKADRKLALARATSVCQFLQVAMSSKIVYTLDAKSDLRVTANARRVSVEFGG